jgi:uncharacterized membrane protein YraQ (UPF0718 family)
MLSNIFWGIVLRTGQAAVEASPTLLCGFIVAGVLRCMLGVEGTRRLFGRSEWQGLLRAWAVGTILPVCSLGVIPIVREMRRAGVVGGVILAFVLAAPHLNPLSLLYGLTLSSPVVILFFGGGSLVIALLAGALWDRLAAVPGDVPEVRDEQLPAPGLKRLVAVAVAATRESVGPTLGYAAVAILLTGVVAGLIPFGSLSTTMRHDNPLAPLLMTALALPVFVGTLPGMMRIGLMFEHGNSVGAAFSLFELGIGVNLGTLIWLSSLFGWRRVLPWMGLVVAATLALAYAAEKPLYFAKEEVDHTHVFDDWSNPFVSGGEGSWQVVHAKLLEKVGVLEPVALGGLAFLMLAGGLLNRFDRQGRVEVYLAAQPEQQATPTARPIWNRDVPGPVLGLVAILGLVVFSIVALYIYYPDPQQAFDEITLVRAEALTAVNTGHREEAIRQLERWDLLTRKLQVGVFIRTGHLDQEKAETADDVRERVEEIRDALLQGEPERARGLVAALEAAHRKCRAAYEVGGRGYEVGGAR